MTSFVEIGSLVNGLLGSVQLMLDLALKSTILLLAAWLLTASLQKASATIRHWVLSAAVIGLLALPFLSLMLPGWRLGILPALTLEAKTDLNTTSIASPLAITPTSVAPEQTNQFTYITPIETTRTPRFEIESGGGIPNKPQKSAWPITVPSFVWTISWGTAALGFWALGALMVIARLLVGTYSAINLASRAKPVTESIWVSMAENLATRLGIRSRVELLQSEQIETPITVGALRSVVILPVNADEWSQQCRNVVLLHELAHVKRRDCLIQNLAQLACAIYWFNPLVWLTAKKLRVERELACDDQVLEAGTKATDYANYLVEIARAFQLNTSGNTDHMKRYSPAAVGMACSQLESRVRSILDPAVRRCGLSRLSVMVASFGFACLVLSLASVQPWKVAALSSVASAQLQANAYSALSDEQTAEVESQTTETGVEKDHLPAVAELPKIQETGELDTLEPGDSLPPQQKDHAKAQSSELTVDQIIAMKTQGVTPEFIESMRKAGLDNLTAQQLTNLKIHDISTEFIGQARNWNGGQVSVNELVQLKVTGVTPEYIAAMKKAGFDGLKLHQLSAMRIHGVTPEFVESMRKAGYDQLTADQLTSLKVHGIDEKYAGDIQRWIGSKPTINDLMQIKIHGVTPEYAQGMKSLGYDNIPVSKLAQMKIHGVSEQYIKEMSGLGFDKLTIEQLVQMRIHGITADYVEKLRAAGLKNVSVNQMIQMKIQGIDSILLKEKR